MTGIRELINDCLDATAEQTAANVMDKVACPPKWRELFLPLVVHEAADRLRQAARAVEAAIPTTGRPAVSIAADRSSYLDERFAIGDGRFVTWGDATVADHEARVAMLSLLRDGLMRTIERHQWAIATIVTAQVSCLNEATEVVAA